jgi:hypothetical protein
MDEDRAPASLKAIIDPRRRAFNKCRNARRLHTFYGFLRLLEAFYRLNGESGPPGMGRRQVVFGPGRRRDQRLVVVRKKK